jgi:hypothetical protein
MKFQSMLSAAIALFIFSGTVEAAKSKPQKGVISKIEKDSGKESGTDTTPAPTAAEEKSFKITESTKLETVSGKKKDATTTPAKFSDFKEGSGVLIISDKKSVDSVKITKAKKTKTKKTAA